MESNERIPQWVLDKHGFKTRREFKQYFRKKLNDLDKASMEFLNYSAYIPRDSWLRTLDLRMQVETLKNDLSQKKWGR